jgi:uncharacterized repeat protein (TIGR01451 family)
VTGADDLSLALYDDTGDIDGIWDAADTLLARAVGHGPAPSLRERALSGGRYWLRVTGEDVSASGAQYDLDALAVPWSADGAYSVQGLPEALTAHRSVTFTVQTARAPRLGERGRLVLGTSHLPEMLVAQIEAAAQADLWVEKSGPAEARADEVLTYTIVYGNDGPSTAEDVVVHDTLPAALTTTMPLRLDAGTLAPGTAHTWTLTATVAAPVETVMPVTNTAQVVGSTIDPDDDDNVEQFVLLVKPRRLYLPLIMRTS